MGSCTGHTASAWYYIGTIGYWMWEIFSNEYICIKTPKEHAKILYLYDLNGTNKKKKNSVRFNMKSCTSIVALLECVHATDFLVSKTHCGNHSRNPRHMLRFLLWMCSLYELWCRFPWKTILQHGPIQIWAVMWAYTWALTLCSILLPML